MAVALLAVLLPLTFVFFGRNRPSIQGTIPLITDPSGRQYSFEQIPPQEGRVAIVTGANTGLGFSTAKLLALKGATVVLACRSTAKCSEARDRILRSAQEARNRDNLYYSSSASSFSPSSVAILPLDLSSLTSVKSFAASFTAQHSRLDALVLNAGIMHAPFSLTTDGIESQFAINHVAHWYLANLLRPLLVASQPSYVTSVASNAAFHRYAGENGGVGLSLETINSVDRYDAIRACEYSYEACMEIPHEKSR